MTTDIICERCGATREDFADKCSAALIEACPGFVTIELELLPDGRNLQRSRLAPDAQAVFDRMVKV